MDGQVVGHVLFSDLSIVTAEGTVAALALAGEPGSVDELEPLYLRVPDAERNVR